MSPKTKLEKFVVATEAEVTQRWPQLSFDITAFTAEAKTRLASDVDYAELRGAELFLTWRCATGDATAIKILDDEYLTKIPERLRRIDSAESFATEVTQRMRERLLVVHEGRLRIADFLGRGSLLSWVQVAAARLALNVRRDERVGKLVDADEVDLVADTADPALQLIKQRHQPDFRAAFGEAIKAISAEDRELLRLHFVDGLTLQQIGKLNRVDKSTISRRLTVLREQLFADTRRRIEARLGLASTEFESLMNVVQSQLHISIERILK